MSDPWIITSRERVKYTEQFKSLHPVNGIVTGAQAKGFFLQSQLPPIVLGQIWALADTDSDGKMNIDEFSIACKLINLNLRGFELPKTLPPVLLSSLSSVGNTPTRTPTGGMSPLDPLASINRPVIPPQPVIPHAVVSPLVSGMSGIRPAMQSAPPLIPQQPLISSAQPLANTGILPMVGAPIQPIIPTQPVAPIQPLIPTGGAIIPPMPPQVPVLPQNMGMDAVMSLVDTSKIISPPNEVVLPAGPTPPHSGTPSRSMSISERAPSIDASNAEWSVKGPAKLKYTQLFNATDKKRTGYLTGVQARGLMLQTKLPQATLAQIWALSDMDSDGRLGCDEFVLAMYLCDLAQQGETIPTVLPPDLIPPAFRHMVSRHGSVSSGSRHGSVSSQGAPQHPPDDILAGIGQTTFEDKRKENFEKGQAELERRRKALLDIQRKEQEERERKEREEFEKREKARIEAEQKRQQELERQLQRQREIEQEKEEQRKRELEKKEAARKELEKQRQLEWENQKILEMETQKQKEQEKVLKLKAQNQSLSVELSTLNEKIKELSQKICDTRTGVSNVKTVIDGMRSTRDQQNSELTQLKARIKEQNHRLVQLSQEKAKLDQKNKANMNDSNNQENAAFSNKQIVLKQLRDKLENTKQQIDEKLLDNTAHEDELNTVKSQLSELVNSCEELYSVYETQRIQILEMKNNRKNESYTSAWDTNYGASDSAWPVEPQPTQSPVKTTTTTAITTNSGAFIKYRALYEFVGRNADEISFQPGDIIIVPSDLNMEPGWLAGEVNGVTGFFPESYVEKMDESSTDITTTIDNKQTLEGISENIETTAITQPAEGAEYYISCYPYESAEVGDLTFNVGEVVIVSKKEGDWWTGTIGTRTGIFPSNYVQPIDVNNSSASNTTATTNGIAPKVNGDIVKKEEITPAADIVNGNEIPEYTMSNDINTNVESTKTTTLAMNNITNEEAKNQAEADSEVSQINTQPKSDEIVNENVQGQYSRPMSTTSTTRNKKPEIAQVIAPYEASSNEQLSLQRGQLIMIRKKTDSGWWEGELQAKGRRKQIGWFPATYVKVLQGGRNSGRNTPVSGARIEMSEQVLDKVIALYPYKALNDDELSFEKDDIISVLGRDEPQWWRGELNGITGLFPSNYVGPFVKSGMV